MVVEALRMPSPRALPVSASALAEFRAVTLWSLLADVLPAEPDPLLAPPAASTVPTEPVVLLLPAWPVAIAAPLVFVAFPTLVTVLVLVDVPVKLALPPSFAAPVVTAPLPVLVIDVNAFTPVPRALPVSAEAVLSTTEVTRWVLLALVLPPAPDPLLAPPAASTDPVVADVVLLPV
jgi:hypothetical protein